MRITTKGQVTIPQHIREKLGNFGVTDVMLLPNQPFCQIPRALACPAQRRFRVATGLRINQKFQRIYQAGVVLCDLSAPCSRLSHSPGRGDLSRLDFLDPFADRLARQTTGSAHARNTTVSKKTGLVGGQQPSCPLVQKRPHTGKLLLKSKEWFHTSLSYTTLTQIATFIHLRCLTVASQVGHTPGGSRPSHTFRSDP